MHVAGCCALDYCMGTIVDCYAICGLCMDVCVRACVCACACVRVCVCVCARVCTCGVCVYVYVIEVHVL